MSAIIGLKKGTTNTKPPLTAAEQQVLSMPAVPMSEAPSYVQDWLKENSGGRRQS